MENLTLLIINRPHGTFKWTIEDGMVTHGFTSSIQEAVENPCSPREFLERNNKMNRENHSGFISAEIAQRIPDDTTSKGYRWITLERLDKTPRDLVSEIFYLREGNIRDRVEHRQDGSIWLLYGNDKKRELNFCPFTGKENTGG